MRRGDPVSRVREALAAHDEALAALGCVVWVGAEPTYTAADSEAPEWLYEALGEDKIWRAQQICARLVAASPGTAMLRSVGRRYAREPDPRWSFGIYARRDGTPVWNGPPDPAVAWAAAQDAPVAAAPGVPGASARDAPGVSEAVVIERVQQALCSELAAAGWPASALRVDAPLPLRVVFRLDGQQVPSRLCAVPEIARDSPHAGGTEGVEAVDALARRGIFLLAAGAGDDHLPGETHTLRVELPALPDVVSMCRLLSVLGTALNAAGVPSVVLGGFPPPVDATVAWTTLTPDPAVVEVNMAPEASVSAFHASLEAIHGAAAAQGLSTHRLHYNGLETDSGGGGQITLGGPSPLASPFLVHPALLPGLVRYFNRHPSLSYCWAPEAAGAASQGPRADEGLRESFHELGLALALLDARPAADPEALQRALAPFMVDASGNTHRAEMNVEKLWHDGLGSRGRQGLVEFRALRMARDPGRASALAALLRAVIARLTVDAVQGPLVDWGDRLHDRFSLPFYLREDLRCVLADLATAGLGLGPDLEDLLLDDDFRHIACADLPGVRVSLSRAVEYWPLIGDVASQEHGGARMLDASTARVEVCLRGEPADLQPWSAAVRGVALPLRTEHDPPGAARVCGVRYRCFKPKFGWHPDLDAHAPLALWFMHPVHGTHAFTLHEWRAGGGAYPGLPPDRADAAARRQARLVAGASGPAPLAARDPPPGACGEHVLDLRWLTP